MANLNEIERVIVDLKDEIEKMEYMSDAGIDLYNKNVDDLSQKLSVLLETIYENTRRTSNYIDIIIDMICEIRNKNAEVVG